MMNSRTETEGQKPKYVWAIVSTMDPNVRKPVFFDTFNGNRPKLREELREAIAAMEGMNAGQPFDEAILPREGWFVARPPKRIPPMFVANGFFVVGGIVREILQREAGDSVTFHPFDLHSKEGGEKIGTFFVVVFRKALIGLDPEREIPGIERWRGSKNRSIRADANDDDISLTCPSVAENLVWLDPTIRHAIFFGENVYGALKRYLTASRFKIVRCRVGY